MIKLLILGSYNTDMVAIDKLKAWICEVSEKFADVTQFQNSEHYSDFAEWEETVLNLLDEYEGDCPEDVVTDQIFSPLRAILYSASEEIPWTGRGSSSFQNLLDSMVYPDAWLWWNATRYDIECDLFPSVRERSTGGQDVFNLGINNNAPIQNLSIPLTRLSVDPGAMVYVGNATASSLHLACDVPSIPNDLNALDTVRRILDPELERNQWQRALIKNRVKHIQSFLRTGTNFFVNPVIIHLDQTVDPNHASVVTDDDNRTFLVINFANFAESDGYLFGEDRPLNLIDGQHRVRGAARSTMGNLLQIPFILIPSTYGPDNAAQLFTEINTTSKELDKDHQLFLAYRFSIAHHDQDLSMGIFVPELNNHHDRANRLAYSMAARLSSEDSPLESQIQMLKSNGSTTCLDISKWLHYAKKWFLPGGPYDYNSHHDEEYIQEELENYFSAWISILGNSWVHQGQNGWNSRSIFQYKTHFRVLLTRFKQIHSITRSRVGEGVLSELEFRITLQPLTNLDSSSNDLKNKFNRTSEFYWQCMDSWITDAIENGIVYPRNEVMSENQRSQAGRGILSSPANSEFWTILDDARGNWPTVQTRYLEVQRPKNCHTTLKIQILNGEEVLTGVSRKSINKPTADGTYRVPIRAGLIPEGVNEIQVRLEWRNAITPIEKMISIERTD